ncbi:DNA cytosine methyltransferase [Vibrio parahaemolyticus]|uniref:DNA cytosine methyltransferase n=1 Tax=Vibrio parahaemolyticus TaxID=670 RepID=UPI0010EF20F2|nr:DNA cytosine methyltransferase [Vibrio parahaemolyticus]EHU4801457.1 DNA cytosine methyltransferase [Vibrio vulnificus]MCS0190594.1 DNA cytosine methyltransferase [Vibrio parahaemolyticus]TBT28752.1 DNA cytosine methyltransferase [Vibrio parahaemolyticus]
MSLKVLDLFAGCGGLSCGLEQAGLEVLAACEIDQWAADTYRHNHPNVEVIQKDISLIEKGFWREKFLGKIDIVAGGPPCQGFSVSGKRQYGIIAESNSLVTDFLRVVEEVEPKYVIIENVKGFKTGSISKNKKVFDYLTDTLKSLGFYVYSETLNAEEYGVPSLRSRIFIIASRTELPTPFMPATHSADINSGLQPYISVNEAISDLPELNASEGIDGAQSYKSKAMSDFQSRMRNGSNGVFNHVAMKHTPRLVERFKGMEEGHSSYRIGRKTDEKKVTSYKMNNQRLYGNRPSLCITANFQSTFIHPTQHRNLTAREAARLMSFPDTYIFKGKRTQMSSKFLKKHGREHEDFLSQYNQIGNAVPPLLGKAVAVGLLNAIKYKNEFIKEEQLEISY